MSLDQIYLVKSTHAASTWKDVNMSSVILDQSHYTIISRGRMKFSKCLMTIASIHFNLYGHYLTVLG